MSGKVTLGEVEQGDVSLENLLDMNALLDMMASTQEHEAEEARARAEQQNRGR